MTDDARLPEAPHAVRLDTEAESGGGRETGGACLRAVPADATAIEPESPPHRFPLGGGRMTDDARLSEAPHAVRLDTEAESGGGRETGGACLRAVPAD
ncbi:hypothetical protein, partial [Streptomyces sp. NPDC017673]|uniref:hypothetical protein n=1 Tax=Streptomyces sp. NPDC017673 TaxID=3365005 RepID=UPI0037988AE9